MENLSENNNKEKAMEITTANFEQRGEGFLKFVKEIQIKAKKNGLTACKLNEILYAES